MTSSWAKTGCDEILIFTDIFPHHELTFKSHFSSREIIFFIAKDTFQIMFWRLTHEKDKTRFLLQKDMKKIIPKKKNKTNKKESARSGSVSYKCISSSSSFYK